MSSQVDCNETQGDLPETGFRWRAWLDRALQALAAGASSVVFIGALRVGIEPRPQDNETSSGGISW